MNFLPAIRITGPVDVGRTNPTSGIPFKGPFWTTRCLSSLRSSTTPTHPRHTAASYLVMSGVDLPTVKEILGHREIEMTLRYSHLAPAHKAKAVEQLGKAFQQITEGQPAEKAEAVSSGQNPANLERFRNVLLVKSGRGLSVISPKDATNQELNSTSKWWRRGESNPRPKVFRQK